MIFDRPGAISFPDTRLKGVGILRYCFSLTYWPDFGPDTSVIPDGLTVLTLFAEILGQVLVPPIQQSAAPFLKFRNETALRTCLIRTGLRSSAPPERGRHRHDETDHQVHVKQTGTPH